MKRIHGSIEENSVESLSLSISGNKKTFEMSLINKGGEYFLVYLAEDGSFIRTLATNSGGGMFYSRFAEEMERASSENIVAKGFEETSKLFKDIVEENAIEERTIKAARSIRLKQILADLQKLPTKVSVGTYEGVEYFLKRNEAKLCAGIYRGEYIGGGELMGYGAFSENSGTLAIIDYIRSDGAILGKRARDFGGEEFEALVRRSREILREDEEVIRNMKKIEIF